MKKNTTSAQKLCIFFEVLIRCYVFILPVANLNTDFEMFWDETLQNDNVPGLSQPASHHALPKIGKTWDVSKMNIIVVSRETSPSFCNERDILHQRRALHILWLIMTTQTHAVLHPSDFLSLLHCYFQDQTEQRSLYVLHCFFPAVPVVGGHTALCWPSRFYLWCVITLPSPLPAASNQFSLLQEETHPVVPCNRQHTC